MRLPLIRTALMLAFGVMLSLFAGATPARAVTCTPSITTLTFSGIDILSGAAVNGQTTLTITCVTTVLDVTGLGQVGVCASIDAGTGGATGTTRRMTNGSNNLNFGLYQDSARSVSWGSTSNTTLGTAPVIIVPVTIPIIGTGGGSASATVFGQVAGSQTTVPVGTYNSTLTVTIQYGLLSTPLNNCSGTLGLLGLSATTTFIATASFTKNCLVSTQNVNFGPHGFLASNIDATGQVRVSCSNPTAYTVALGTGSFTATTRRMVSGSNFVVYGLYQDSGHSVPWGQIAGQTLGGNGTGLTQNLTVYGRVPPQTTPPPATYTDTVPVTVTY